MEKARIMVSVDVDVDVSGDVMVRLFDYRVSRRSLI